MLHIILSIIMAIVSIILVIVIFAQEPKESGLGAGLVGGNENTYQYKKYSREGKLTKYTAILAVIFFILAILLNLPFISNLF